MEHTTPDGPARREEITMTSTTPSGEPQSSTTTDTLLVLTVPTDLTQPLCLRRISRGLSSLQSLVGLPGQNGYVEAVRGAGVQHDLPMTGWVHDSGLIDGMPVNWRLSVLLGYPGPLFGDGFINGPVDVEGDETDFPLSYLPVVSALARDLLVVEPSAQR